MTDYFTAEDMEISYKAGQTGEIESFDKCTPSEEAADAFRTAWASAHIHDKKPMFQLVSETRYGRPNRFFRYQNPAVVLEWRRDLWSSGTPRWPRDVAASHDQYRIDTAGNGNVGEPTEGTR